MLFKRRADRWDADPCAIDRAAGGTATVFTVEALADEAYAYRLLLSDDLAGWRVAVTAPGLAPAANGYQSRIYVVDPVAEGFASGARLFGRIEGLRPAP